MPFGNFENKVFDKDTNEDFANETKNAKTDRLERRQDRLEKKLENSDLSEKRRARIERRLARIKQREMDERNEQVDENVGLALRLGDYGAALQDLMGIDGIDMGDAKNALLFYPTGLLFNITSALGDAIEERRALQNADIADLHAFKLYVDNRIADINNATFDENDNPNISLIEFNKRKENFAKPLQKVADRVQKFIDKREIDDVV